MKIKIIFSLLFCFQYSMCSQDQNNNNNNNNRDWMTEILYYGSLGYYKVKEYHKNEGKVEAYENVFKQQPQSSNNQPNQQIQTNTSQTTSPNQPKVDTPAPTVPDINVKTSIEIKQPTNTYDQVKDGIRTAGEVIIVANSVYNAYHFIRSMVAPTNEEKLRAQQTEHELKRLDAEKKLNNCLTKYRREKRSVSGTPIQCEEESITYQQIAGFNAFNQISKAFQQTFPEDKK